MKKEFISIKRKETSIKLQASSINSIRVKDIERHAVRVYKDGYIGISGAVGESDIDTLTTQAIDNLAAKIKYPHALERQKKDHRNYNLNLYSETQLMDVTKTILSSLKKDYDNFIFSESIKSIEMDYSFHNTEGLDLRYQDESLSMGIIVKSKASSNLFDTYIGWQGRHLDVDRFLFFVKNQLQAESTPVEIPEGDKLPVFFLEPQSFGTFLLQHLNGETYGNGASIFKDKLGKQVFNKKLTLVQNNNSETSHSKFFDAEGVTLENDEIALIENGVIKHVFTNKKVAKRFNLTHTGSAAGGYDDIPTLGFVNIDVKVDSSDIVKVLEGQPAIFVMVAAGGEVNADGHFATPVQAAYLFDGKTFQGKLPNFNMNNSIFDMLGDDYIGTFSSDDLYFGEHHYTVGCYMNINK